MKRHLQEAFVVDAEQEEQEEPKPEKTPVNSSDQREPSVLPRGTYFFSTHLRNPRWQDRAVRQAIKGCRQSAFIYRLMQKWFNPEREVLVGRRQAALHL